MKPLTNMKPAVRGKMIGQIFRSSEVVEAFTRSDGTPLSQMMRQNTFDQMHAQFSRKTTTVPGAKGVYEDKLIRAFITTAEVGRRTFLNYLVPYDPDLFVKEEPINFARSVLKKRTEKKES